MADSGEVLHVEIIAGHHRLASSSRRGGPTPTPSTALDKSLSAFSGAVPGRTRPQSRRRGPRDTVTERDRLGRELHAVRAEQVAFDREEAALGLRRVAAPILAAA